jgi:uroporphyrinogen decarboxylase
MSMTPKERFLAVLQRQPTDRLPVTTHHVMSFFLNRYMNGISSQQFFDSFGLDPIQWIAPHRPDSTNGDYFDPYQSDPGFLESRRIASDTWQITEETLDTGAYPTKRYTMTTPKGALCMATQSNEHTSWVTEHLVKEKRDIDWIAEYVTAPRCDVEAVNQAADAYGQRGLLRSHICCFDIYGQPGTWQDACCLYGTENMIFAAHDDPEWVHTFLTILQARKLSYTQSLAGARYDLLELGGGSASTTVISPKLFDRFVAPYDAPIIEAAHAAGQRIVYHTCGGMMPILERIADMGPDAMETFTPPAMGGDVDLTLAKKRIGDRVCMIGGFDQFHYLTGCTPEDTRAEVRRCFAAAGESGGFILSPSDHFFDADLDLIRAFADEARACTYSS